MYNEQMNESTICGGDKQAEAAMMGWQERMCLGFNQMHTALLNIRKGVDESGANAGSARLLVDQMERGALAPMRRLRDRFGIPFDWSVKD